MTAIFLAEIAVIDRFLNGYKLILRSVINQLFVTFQNIKQRRFFGFNVQNLCAVMI